jgi:hypothetical protein
LPLPRKSPFSQLENTGRISADGWGVSLIDFMIPGSEAESSQDGGTYGFHSCSNKTRIRSSIRPANLMLSP